MLGFLALSNKCFLNSTRAHLHVVCNPLRYWFCVFSLDAMGIDSRFIFILLSGNVEAPVLKICKGPNWMRHKSATHKSKVFIHNIGFLAHKIEEMIHITFFTCFTNDSKIGSLNAKYFSHTHKLKIHDPQSSDLLKLSYVFQKFLYVSIFQLSV